jgi:ankyrin repeat protein
MGWGMFRSDESQNDILYRAVCNNDKPAALAALKAGANPDYVFSHSSMLGFAMFHAEYTLQDPLSMSRLLLENGANPNNSHLFFTAIRLKRYECALLLQKHGANINQPNQFGVTPLQRAAEDNEIYGMKILLGLKAHIDLTKFNEEAKKNMFDFLLSHVCTSIDELSEVLGKKDKEVRSWVDKINLFSGYLTTLKLKDHRKKVRDHLSTKALEAFKYLDEILSLKQAKIDLDYVINNIELLQGVGSGGFGKKTAKVDLLRCLSEIDPRIDVIQNDFLACIKGKYREKFSAYLQTGIDVNYANKAGVTPLLFAGFLEDPFFVKHLLDAGAVLPPYNKVKAQPSHVNKTLSTLNVIIGLELEVLFLDCITLTEVKKLSIDNVNKITDMIERAGYLETKEICPDFFATLQNSFSKNLNKFPAKHPHRINAKQVEVAFNAVIRGLKFLSWPNDGKVATLFNEFKEKIKTEVQVQSCLLLAAQTDWDVSDAIASGADVNFQDDQGNTALMRSIISQEEHVFYSLAYSMRCIEGVNLDLVNKDGLTAIELAAKKNMVNVVDYLLKMGANQVVPLSAEETVSPATAENKEEPVVVNAADDLGNKNITDLMAALFDSSGGQDTDTLINAFNARTALFSKDKSKRKKVRSQLATVLENKKNNLPVDKILSVSRVVDKIITRLDLIQGPGSHKKTGDKEVMHELKALKLRLEVDKQTFSLALDDMDPFEALTSGNKAMVMAALEKGVDVNCRNASGKTPLTFLVRYYDKEALQLLIAHGATINWIAISYSVATAEQIVNVSDALRAVLKQEMQDLMQEINSEKIALFIESINKKSFYFSKIFIWTYHLFVDEDLLEEGRNYIDGSALLMSNYDSAILNIFQDLKAVILDRRAALASIVDEPTLTAAHACLSQALKGLTIFKMDDMKKLKSLVESFLEHLQARIDRLTGADAPSYKSGNTQFKPMTSSEKAKAKEQLDDKKEAYFGIQNNNRMFNDL